MNPELFQLAERRILLLDGAMGSLIQSYHLTEEDYRGSRFATHPIDLQGNNDLLSLTCPAIITEIHQAYLNAGADILETNTFNANGISQQDYQLASFTYELNRESALLACQAVKRFQEQHPGETRFVAGSIGPTNRTLSLSPDVNDPTYRAVTFTEMVQGYREQARGLLDGGVDLLLVETVFDSLNCKAALYAIQEEFTHLNEKVPIMVSATVSDASGRLLNGQTLEAFLIAIEHLDLFSIGLNCSLGPAEMAPLLEEFSRLCPTRVSAHPNAGLPNELGEYDLAPAAMAEMITGFAQLGWVDIVGGCCGTTPEHIAALKRKLSRSSPRRPIKRTSLPRLSGLEPLVIREDSLFLNVGERTNVAGSRRFARLVRNNQLDQALAVADDQVQNGAQMLDINMDDPLLDAREAMISFLRLLTGEPRIASVPIMLDSSDWSVLEAGLQNLPGKGIVNSISLKDGETEFLRRADLIRRYGAAVLVMAFDEEGQAASYDRKISILERAYHLLIEQCGFRAEDIFLDPNIFAIATGLEEHRKFAIDYLESVKWIRKHLPGATVSGGISNLSFSFRGNDILRNAMHGIFLYHAIRAGLRMGIVNAGQLPVYDEIPDEMRTTIEAVLFDRDVGAAEQLLALAHSVKSQPRQIQENTAANAPWRQGGISDRVQTALVEGIDTFIQEDMESAVKEYSDPLTIIEGPLMAGMQQVGDLFGAGKMFLPQVVKSARIMKQAVTVLEPHLHDRDSGSPGDKGRGTILLATVKGDVHDIGKNIVAVILRCNGYRVLDLGVMVSADHILSTAIREEVNIIGLSGLITPSLREMVHIAKEMSRRNIDIPLLIGGATTSRKHTALKIAPETHSPVVHVQDASRAATVVSQLLKPGEAGIFRAEISCEYAKIREQGSAGAKVKTVSLHDARLNRTTCDWDSYHIPIPRQRQILCWEDYDLNSLIPYIDWTPFFNVWHLKGKYPAIMDHPDQGSEARRVWAESQTTLSWLLAENQIQAQAVTGIFPVNSDGDDVVIWDSDLRTNEVMRIPFIRQQVYKGSGKTNLCLADFVAPATHDIPDYLGMFAVTAGLGVSKLSQDLGVAGDDYQKIMLQALADRFAEALAEKLHEDVRREIWAYQPDEHFSPDQLLTQIYRGIRPAPGYPACPDHGSKRQIFGLLDVVSKTEIRLTPQLAMDPGASICGFYFAHPQAQYFSVGKISEDQLSDFCKRSQRPSDEVRAELFHFLIEKY